MVPGIFILLNKSLMLSNPSNVLNALCSFVISTGLIVYPYLRAYFMNPFLDFIKTLNYLGVVNVASSYPPGTSEMSYPFFMSLFKFFGSTD